MLQVTDSINFYYLQPCISQLDSPLLDQKSLRISLPTISSLI